MRNMSFSLTTPQFRARSKDVTRRLGWSDLQAGETVMGIEKGQGIPKGGHVVRLGSVDCVSNRPERLDRMITEPDYGRREVIREGFPELSPLEFVTMFCKHNGCEPETIVNRIEFRYCE